MALEIEVKALPVLASLVTGIVLGRLWFSKRAFGPAWLSLLGKTEAETPGRVPVRAYATVLVANTLTYVLLAILLASTGTSGLLGGLLVGALCGGGFVAAMIFVDDAFVDRPVRHSMITAPFRILQLSLAGSILAGWRNAPF